MAVVVLLAAVLCGAAGTLRFWEAWAYAGMLYAVMTATNAYLLRRAPALLERRLVSNRETQRAQRFLKASLYLSALAMYATAGLDRRAGWSHVPPALVACAFVVVAAGALLVFLVLRENRHASVVIEVAAEQRVVVTGPYRWVRHPMYLGALLQAVATPLALGSYWAEIFVAAACAVVVLRLLAEERFLCAQLAGYAEYARKTPHRLVPGLW
jgi:protein-S-isoprenylcysteine O-methyltransferase Ste14